MTAQHWDNEQTPQLTLCGQPRLVPGVDHVEHVTCPDCMLRIMALLHRDTAVLLKGLAGIIQSYQNRIRELETRGHGAFRG